MNSNNYRVSASEKVKFKKWPTRIKPGYKPREQYQEILVEHIQELSAQPFLADHYMLTERFEWHLAKVAAMDCEEVKS